MEIKDKRVVREISIGGLEIKKYQKVKHNEVEIMRQKKKERDLFQEVHHLKNITPRKKVKNENGEKVIIKELRQETSSEHRDHRREAS